MTLQELAQRLGGEVKGDPSVEIHAVMPMDEAGPGAITFLANPKYIPKLNETNASAIIVPPEFKDLDRNLIVIENPYLAFARAAGLLMERKFPPEPGVSDAAFVHPDAQIGKDAAIYPGAYVAAGARIGDRAALYPGVYVGEECEIGEDTILFPNTVVYPLSLIGKRCIIHANCTIGSAGFGYAPDGSKWEKIPQVRRAVIGDDVEIGANSIVNRGAARDTVVGRGTKIDSLVIISHGVQVGEDCLFVSQSGVAGSATIGNHCTFAGQVGVAGHITIGDNVEIGAKSAVRGDLAPNKRYLGQPAIELEKARRVYMNFVRLPEMKAKLRELERAVADLQKKLNAQENDE